MKYRLDLGGVNVDWDIDLETGIQRWNGHPTLTMWVESTLLGLMMAMQSMVGTERFNLSLLTCGQQSVENDWAMISSFPTFEEGFELWARATASVGWGRCVLRDLDRPRRVAHFRVTNSWESLYQKKLNVSWGARYMGGKLAGICSKLFGVHCGIEQTADASAGSEYDEFKVTPSDVTLEAQMEEILRSDHATRADLTIAFEKLRHEIEERKATELTLREKLAIIKRQEEAIQALSTPILKVWDSVLAVPLIGVINGERASGMITRVLQEIAETRSQYLIVDLTGVDVIDTSTADHILKIVQSTELLGARCVITGIRPAVAQTMTSLGMDISRVVTLSDLQQGIKRCIQWSSEGSADRAR
ncbi:MAG TPA: STAS domain-containing protein [Polyangiaceae bacterium]|nr:STAS domain-containing protein [Polyangiaceae bacterium]